MVGGEFEFNHKKLDIVVCGPDGSGTSTQIEDIIKELSKIKIDNGNARIKDLRGTYVHALWHARDNPYRSRVSAEQSFTQLVEQVDHLREKAVSIRDMKSPEWFETNRLYQQLERYKTEFGSWAADKIRVVSLASMKETKNSSFVDPRSADVWIMEEPPYRGCGMHIRSFELFREAFGAQMNQTSTAMAFSLAREMEYFTFRKEILAANRILIRSRSEESACYQVFDEKLVPTGPTLEQYLALPGHKFAFGEAPTHIFVACGPKDWKVNDMQDFAQKRLVNRVKDDFEKNPEYQLKINQRYRGEWLEDLYEKGCKMHGGTIPKIIRFDMTEPMSVLASKMAFELGGILHDAGYIPKPPK